MIWKTGLAAMASLAALSAPMTATPTATAATVFVTGAAHRYPNGYRGAELIGRSPRTPASISSSGPPLPRPSARTAGKKDRLTVKVLDRDGRAPADTDVSYAILVPIDGSDQINERVTNGTVADEVPTGRYAILAYVTTPGGRPSLTAVYLPDVSVTKDLTLTLDARRGRRAGVAADNPDARPVPDGAVARIDQKIGGIEQEVAGFPITGEPTYVTPAAPAPGLAFRLQARLTRKGATYGSPYIYNVGVTLPGGIPGAPTTRVITRDMGKVRTSYASNGEASCAGGHTYADWPGGMEEGLFAGIGALPATRTEYFSPSVEWGADSAMTTRDCSFTALDVRSRLDRFTTGSYTRSWFTAPTGPGGDFDSRLPDGTFELWAPLLSSSTESSGLAPNGGLTGTTVLKDATGKIIGTGDQPGFATFTLPQPAARYTAIVDASRQVPYSDLAVRQHDGWTFTSKKPRGAYSTVPLLEVLYRTALDSADRAAAGHEQTITLLPVDGSAGEPDGIPTRLAALRRMAMWISYDDGSTWQPVRVRKTAHGWVAEVRSPTGPKARFASLRVTAEDTGGRTADQTLIRAYAIKH